MKIRKSMGPRISPCGTPEVAINPNDVQRLQPVNRSRLSRYRYKCMKLDSRRLLWSTLNYSTPF